MIHYDGCFSSLVGLLVSVMVNHDSYALVFNLCTKAIKEMKRLDSGVVSFDYEPF